MTVKITEAVAKKVLSVVDKGLVSGLGEPIPGQMCVEAAVCYAMGEDHGDNPLCVHYDVRDFKVHLNDTDGWKSKKSRAAGLRRVAIAQLGTVDHTSGDSFLEEYKSYLDKKYLIPKCHQLVDDGEFDLLSELASAMNNGFGIIEDVIEYVTRCMTLKEICQSNSMEKFLCALAEDAVQVLIKLKSPGSKYLYLTKAPKKVGGGTRKRTK